MGDKHAERDKADLQHFASPQNGIGLRVRAEHSLEQAHRDGEIGRAKEDPRQTDRAIGGQAEDYLDEETLRPLCVVVTTRGTSRSATGSGLPRGR